MRYTRDELSNMPLVKLRNLSINSKQEEDLVQEILDIRMKAQPLAQPFKLPSSATDPHKADSKKIAELQKQVDEENAKRRGEVEQEITEPEVPEDVDVEEAAPVEEVPVEIPEVPEPEVVVAPKPTKPKKKK